MPINPDAVGAETKPSESRWTSKDCLLYALGVGAGQLDAIGFELEFTTENSQDVAQRVLPTFAVVASVNSGGGSLSAIGTFDHAMLVHGEQAIELHRPLPVEGHISTVGRIAAIYDKGAAAVVVTESTATEVARASRCSPAGRPSSSGARAVGAATGARRGEPSRRRATPTTRSPIRPVPTRRCSTGSRATGTPCMPTRSSRPGPGSPSPSCTACAPTASPAGPCSTPCAAPIPIASCRCPDASPSRSSRATP